MSEILQNPFTRILYTPIKFYSTNQQDTETLESLDDL
jgi:hypothetical protein